MKNVLGTTQSPFARERDTYPHDGDDKLERERAQCRRTDAEGTTRKERAALRKYLARFEAAAKTAAWRLVVESRGEVPFATAFEAVRSLRVQDGLVTRSFNDLVLTARVGVLVDKSIVQRAELGGRTARDVITLVTAATTDSRW